jgi:hypothetical protein
MPPGEPRRADEHAGVLASREARRPIRDEIGERVRALLDILGVPTRS